MILIYEETANNLARIEVVYNDHSLYQGQANSLEVDESAFPALPEPVPYTQAVLMYDKTSGMLFYDIQDRPLTPDELKDVRFARLENEITTLKGIIDQLILA